MGKVFSWDEIEGNKIPELQSFSVVAERIRRDLEASDGVISGIFYGSIFFHSCTLRSDIDCVVVYNSAQHRNIIEMLQNIQQAAAALHVPIEFTPLDAQIASTSLRHAGLSFAASLRYAVERGGFVKKDPLPLFSFEGFNPAEDVCSYLCNKLWNLEKGLSKSSIMEFELYRFLQKVLEAPVHVARKMLWLSSVQMIDDSRQEIVRRYPEIASAQEQNLFTRLVEADNQYTAQLLAQLRKPDKDHYKQTIEEIKCLVWDALEFVRLNAFRLI